MFLRRLCYNPSYYLRLFRCFSGTTPSDRFYTKEHEWIMTIPETPNHYRIGITDSAQRSLGDIVFVEFSRSLPGELISANDILAIVESVKGASDVFSPIGGKISEINKILLEKPSMINKSPYSEGWICQVQAETDYHVLTASLLNATEYDNYCKGIDENDEN